LRVNHMDDEGDSTMGFGVMTGAGCLTGEGGRVVWVGASVGAGGGPEPAPK
jgi:hypothetical protein